MIINIGGELSIPNHKLLDPNRVDYLEQQLDALNQNLHP